MVTTSVVATWLTWLYSLTLVCCRDLEYDYVTCGSAVKLYNIAYRSRLHSHDVKYGSGSGQQSVTGVDAKDDNNSHWQIRAKMGEICTRGEPVKCGSTVRFAHLATGKNLHSHLFKSPISRYQEVSCFGEDGEGDTGDNWSVVCASGEFWRRDDPVRLRHVDTGEYLHMTGDTFGRPISGQREVSCYSSLHTNNQWKVAEGVYIKPSEHSRPGPPA